MLALAPSFDTAGLLARDPVLLRTAAEALLTPGDTTAPITQCMVDEELVSLAEPEVRASFEAACRALTLRTALPLAHARTGAAGHLQEWFAAFRTVQAAEAWEQHGAWITRHPGALAPDVAARFENGRRVSAAERAQAEQVLSDARKALDAVLPPGTALLLPATSGPAPLADAPPEEVEAVRAATLRLTCLASLAGLPAVVAPLLRVRSLPVGLCALGARGTDRALLDFITDSRNPAHA
ncbi:hypothetical protein [Streptomyces sp. NPDC002172]